MPEFLIRLLIGIGVIWIVELLLGEFGIKEPARKIIFIIVLIVSIIFILTGSTYLPLR